MSLFEDIAPDFAFYQKVYRGKKLDTAGFEASLTDSIAEVEFRLRPGITLADDVIVRAKMAVCSICEAISDTQSRLRSYTAGKTSETFDAPPYSLTAEAAVKRYLSGCNVLKGGSWV